MDQVLLLPPGPLPSTPALQAAASVLVPVPAPAQTPAAPIVVPLDATAARPAPPGAPAGRTPRFTHLSTGSVRLDGLLGGGFPAGTATLLYGPPFVGKQVLQQVAFAAAVVRGVPGTFLLHGTSADAMSQRLRHIDPRVADAEAAGLVTYVDAHSQFLGEPTEHPNALYVEQPDDSHALGRTLQERGATQGLLAIQSASTLLLDLGPTKAFQFLRNVLGRTVKGRGVALVSLQAGMHPETDVQMAKHLCGGMLELRRKGEHHCLHVEGLETTVARPGWVEYESTTRAFRLTGSFARRAIH